PGQGSRNEHGVPVHAPARTSRHPNGGGGGGQRGMQRLRSGQPPAPSVHESGVHWSVLRSRHAPVVLPWQSARHPRSVARHAAPPLRNASAQLPRHAGTSLLPRHAWTHILPFASTSPKHTRASLPHADAHEPGSGGGSGQSPRQPSSALVQAAFACVSASRHVCLQVARSASPVHAAAQALSAVLASARQTRRPPAQLAMHMSLAGATGPPSAKSSAAPTDMDASHRLVIVESPFCAVATTSCYWRQYKSSHRARDVRLTRRACDPSVVTRWSHTRRPEGPTRST